MSFPPFAVTVDVALFTLRVGRLAVLLVERGEEPFTGLWALPGGFVREHEALEVAAERELAEETGLSALHLEQLGTYGDPRRDPRMRVVSVAWVAAAPDLPAPAGGSDAASARFWPVEDLAAGGGELDLAFDHDEIVRDALERVRAKLEYTPLAFAFCEQPFTLADLRRVYEAVWGAPLDPGNFQRKVLGTPGFVTPTKAVSPPGRAGGRRARLYRGGDANSLHPAMLRRAPPE